MLPEFPNLQRDISTLIREFVIARKRQLLGELGRISNHMVMEGHQTAITRDDGENEITEMVEASAEVRIPFDDFPNLELDGLFERFEPLAQHLAQAQTEHLFAAIDRGSAKVGNTVDAKGQKFSADLYLKMLNKLMIEFDPDGKAKIPTLHVGPQMQDRVRTVLEDLHADPKLRKQLEAIIERKYEEWRVREASRELAG